MADFELDLKNIKRKTSRAPKPNKYILHEGLFAAIKVAIATHQPLLITGEPGTGKTQLAYKIAQMLYDKDKSFLPQPLRFNTKTTSVAQDLFYTYDALGHFHAAHLEQNTDGKDIEAVNHIVLQALGEAIARGSKKELGKKRLETVEGKVISGRKKNSVVLIDEIDKAPRDFTNDLLNEIERFEFFMKEMGTDNHVTKDDDATVVLILTSNSERNLPEAFLRRCVFYHIPFPDKTQLLNIVSSHFESEDDELFDSAVDLFLRIRKTASRKPPATAELLSWIHILEMEDLLETISDTSLQEMSDFEKKKLRFSTSVLVKTQDDIAAVEKLLK